MSRHIITTHVLASGPVISKACPGLMKLWACTRMTTCFRGSNVIWWQARMPTHANAGSKFAIMTKGVRRMGEGFYIIYRGRSSVDASSPGSGENSLSVTLFINDVKQPHAAVNIHIQKKTRWLFRMCLRGLNPSHWEITAERLWKSLIANKKWFSSKCMKINFGK